VIVTCIWRETYTPRTGIPNAGLSAIIIHAVADLVASPAQAFMFWRVAPLEYIIWLAAVLVTIFSSIGTLFWRN
jgi:MFS superfamily sulfate permease-like transporter